MSIVRRLWFVTYHRPERSRSQRYLRLSETFANEFEAKAFARRLFDDGYSITAGTINPHVPKRFIGSRQAADWLDEPGTAG